MKHFIMTLFLTSAVYPTFSLAAPLDIKSLVGAQKSIPHEGGSGVGGGNLYTSILSWCDDSSITLQEAQDEAQDLWSLQNDQLGAIHTYYNGLQNALTQVPEEGVNFDSSITYKAISRGLSLSHILGISSLISGDMRVKHTDKDFRELIDVMKFYYSFIKKVTNNLDKKFYVPYYQQMQCPGCTQLPSIQTIELEKEFIRYSVSQINEWRNKFIVTNSNKEGSYPTLNLDLALKGLRFFINETAKDLKHNLLQEVYSCQIKQLKSLANKIEIYTVSRRTDNRLDGIKLNQFTNRIDEIIKNINEKDCQ